MWNCINKQEIVESFFGAMVKESAIVNTSWDKNKMSLLLVPVKQQSPMAVPSAEHTINEEEVKVRKTKLGEQLEQKRSS